MQDQGKRIMLAVALAIGVFFIWNMAFPPPKEDKPAQTTVATGSGSAAAPAVVPSKIGVAAKDATPAPAVTPATPAAPVVTAPAGPEQLIKKTYPNVEATFSNHGAVLASWKLTDPRYQKDATKGELLPKQVGAGAFQVNFAVSTFVIPANASWTSTEPSADQIVYKYTSAQLDVTKTFTIHAADYLVTMVVDYTARPAAGAAFHQTLALTSYGYQDPADDGGGQSRSVQARVWASSTLRTDGTIISTPPEEVLKAPRYESHVRWTGFEHPYLLVGFAPQLHDDLDDVQKRTFPTQPRGMMETDMLFATSSKLSDRIVISAFLGPKDYDKLTGADAPAQFKTGFRAVVDLGWFSFIGQPLLWLLQQFYKFVGNWGVSIILLTLLVKLATLYWTTKSMRSMKAMAALAPRMKELQAKYADDKQRQQAETMALYKQHGVNPLAGCLPIVLQMPIWLALYRMLSSAGELYLQPFIPGWINDLTNVDPYHVLPVVLVITMFVQARLQPAAATGGQQKLMQYVMPLGFGAMSFFFPAGLTLYIFTNTLLSAVHSLYMNKYDKQSLASAALLKADTERVKAGGAVKPAKPVIDVTANAANDDDDGDDSPSPTGAGPNRPRKKKRKR